jgi:hypothetical protein
LFSSIESSSSSIACFHCFYLSASSTDEGPLLIVASNSPMSYLSANLSRGVGHKTPSTLLNLSGASSASASKSGLAVGGDANSTTSLAGGAGGVCTLGTW